TFEEPRTFGVVLGELDLTVERLELSDDGRSQLLLVHGWRYPLGHRQGRGTLSTRSRVRKRRARARLLRLGAVKSKVGSFVCRRSKPSSPRIGVASDAGR